MNILEAINMRGGGVFIEISLSVKFKFLKNLKRSKKSIKEFPEIWEEAKFGIFEK